jgi:hypothetical protein
VQSVEKIEGQRDRDQARQDRKAKRGFHGAALR